MKNGLGKKLAASALALTLVMSPLTGTVGRAAAESAKPQTATASFTDVEQSYAKTEIAELVKLGILSGDGSGHFNPTASSTRAELAKVLCQTLGLRQNTAAAASFKDIPANAWYKGYVGALVEARITTGTSGSSFSPNEQVSREALAVFYVRAMGLEKTAQALSGKTEFADAAQISAWAMPAVSLAAKLGFIQGVKQSDGKLYFQPTAKAERQALARLTYSFYVNKDEYVKQAAKLAVAVSPTPTPSASTTPTLIPSGPSVPTPTPTPGTDGSGHVPSSPTPAPTLNQGDPTVTAPYYVDPYTAKTSEVTGVVDGHATVRIYYQAKLVMQCESAYSGQFSAYMGTDAYRIEDGILQVTSQRAGEKESLPINVKIIPAPQVISQSPVVDAVYAGDFIVSGKARSLSLIVVKDSTGEYLDDGLAMSDGSFSIPVGERHQGEVLQIIARDIGKAPSQAVALTVGAARTDAPTVIRINFPQIPAGPLLVVAESSDAITSYEIVTGSNRVYQTQYNNNIFSLINPSIMVNPGDTVTVRAQSPGKSPSKPLTLTVGPAVGKTNKPVAGEVKYNTALPVDTEKDALLFLRDDQDSWSTLFSYGPLDSHRFLEISLKPGKTYRLYALRLGMGISDPVPVVVPPVTERTASPTVTDVVYEGDRDFLIHAEPGTRLRIYPLNPPENGSYPVKSVMVLQDGTYRYPLTGAVHVGDRFAVVGEQNGLELSKPTIVTLQALPSSAGGSADLTVTGAVYEGDYMISVLAKDRIGYSYVTVIDDHGKTLYSGSLSDNSGYPQGILLNTTIPLGTKQLTVTAQQSGRKSTVTTVPVSPVTGQTDSVKILTDTFTTGYPSTLRYQGNPNDYILVFWNGHLIDYISVSDSAVQDKAIMLRTSVGDHLDFVTVTPGKLPTVKSFIIQAR
jgi:hypothetical protein